MEFTINIPSLDKLADAIMRLADAQQHSTPNIVPAPVTVIDTTPIASALPDPITYAETAYNPPAAPITPPVTPPAYNPPAAPITPPVAPPVTPPATPVTYTRQQISIAATGLVDAGKKDLLLALLAQFQLRSITELPEQSFGAFATALRQMGAAI